MRPDFSREEAVEIVSHFYGFACEVKHLPSYSDQNFLVRKTGRAYAVLKIANAAEPPAVVAFQQEALQHIEKTAPELSTPHVIAAADGSTLNSVPAREAGKNHLVWMVNYLPGQFISSLPSHPPQLLESFGAFMGRLDHSLASFEHEAMHRTLQWDFQNVDRLPSFFNYIKDFTKRSLVIQFMERYESHGRQAVSRLRKSVIHNDANDNNVLVSTGAKNASISGIIDFGDMVYSYTAGELAIAIAYMILGKQNPLATASRVLYGYHRTYPLLEPEIAALFDLICLRLCTSVCMSAKERSLDPDNEYLAISEQPAWNALKILADIEPDLATAHFISALS